MKFILIISTILLWSSIEHSFGQENLKDIFCELPAEGKDTIYSCIAERLPVVKELLELFADCFGQSIGNAWHLRCCNREDNELLEKIKACSEEANTARNLTDRETYIFMKLTFGCLIYAVDVHAEDMELPIDSSKPPSTCP